MKTKNCVLCHNSVRVNLCNMERKSVLKWTQSTFDGCLMFAWSILIESVLIPQKKINNKSINWNNFDSPNQSGFQCCTASSLQWESVHTRVSVFTRPLSVFQPPPQFGDSQQLRLVRILRSTVMVRVGGGWMALDEFLVKNDPCRGEFKSSPQEGTMQGFLSKVYFCVHLCFLS